MKAKNDGLFQTLAEVVKEIGRVLMADSGFSSACCVGVSGSYWATTKRVGCCS